MTSLTELPELGVYFHGDWSRSGPRLVFVHGFGMDQAFFKPLGKNSPFLDWAQRLPLLAIDLPGHGNCVGLRDNQGRPTMTASDLAADVASRIQSAMACCGHSNSPIILFGHSLGGTVCLYLADLLPQVSEVILADPFLVLDLTRHSQQAVRQESMALAHQHNDPEVIFALIRDVFASFTPHQLRLDVSNPLIVQLISVAARIPVTLGRGLRDRPGSFRYGKANELVLGECGALLSETDYATLGGMVNKLYLSPNADVGHFAMVFDPMESWVDCVITLKY